MSGRKSFKVLRDRVVADPARRERVERLGRAYDAVLGLADLRESCGLTQKEVAGSLGVSQPNVSKIEHTEDIYISTLCGYIEALGGHLEVRAVFPNQAFHLGLPAGHRSAEKRAAASR